MSAITLGQRLPLVGWSASAGGLGRVEARRMLRHPAYLVVTDTAIGPLLEDGDVVDVLEAGETGREPALLRHVAEPAADLGTPGRQRAVVAEQPDLARGGRDDGCHDSQQCRLAGPVWPE